MRRFRTSFCALLAVTLPSVAIAADMPRGRGPVVIGESDSYSEEIGTGWYLRGDVGYSKATDASLTIGAQRFDGVGRGGTTIYGFGFGYKFNDFLRADLTIDQIATLDLKKRVGSVGCFGTDTCTIDRSFDGSVTPVLANAYVDLGNWSGITPYVGGGIGGALIRGRGTFTYTDITSGGTVTTTAEGGKTWSPAFAAMGGVAVDLGAGLTLDAGYRYLWLSHGTGPIAQQGSFGAVPASVDYRSSGFHQARLGLRYYVY